MTKGKKAKVTKVKQGTLISSEITIVGSLLEAREALATVGGKYRQGLNNALAKIYSSALAMQSDGDAWQDFCRHRSWDGFKGKRPTVDDPTDTLQPAIRFAVGFEDTAASKLASKYSKALGRAWADKVPPDEVTAFIEEHGGIEKLASGAAATRNGVGTRNKPPKLTMTAALDELSRKLLGCSVGDTVKVKLAVVSTDGEGALDVVLGSVKPQ